MQLGPQSAEDESLTYNGLPPTAIQRTPVDALDQHGELRRSETDSLISSAEGRPFEDPVLKPLGEEARPGAVLVDDLDEVGFAAEEMEQVVLERVV